MRTATYGLIGLVAGVTGLACQSYNMEGVDPQTVIAVETTETFTAGKPPALLVVQDRSGSMKICFGEGGESGDACDVDGDTEIDTQGRSSRMNVAQRVMTQVVGGNADDVLFGLVLYGVGGDGMCGDPVEVAPPALDSAGSIVNAYASHDAILEPAGGTPTTVALARAREIMLDETGAVRSPERQNYVVLVTDGLMNCNMDHPMPCVCAQEDGCFLLDSPGQRAALGDVGEFGVQGQPFPAYCLDIDNSLAEVETLRNAGVRTFVIGLGEGFSGTGAEVAVQSLNELAVAGGVPNEGERKFYSAANEAELEAALADIIDRIQVPCQYELDGPVCDGRLLHVTMQVDGEEIPTSCDAGEDPGENTWSFVDERTITFSPDLCRRFEQADDVRISIKGVESGCSTDDQGALIGPACDLRTLQ